MPNYYLTGMMGSGKSVTGKRLAQRLSCIFTDLDDLVQEKTGRTIADIFEREGEGFFRDLESEILQGVAREDYRVVATGGGTILRAENVEAMRRSGTIIYLETSLEMLWQRVKDKRDRPLLRTADPRAALAGIYEARRPLYEKHQDFRVATDGKTADAVADEILRLLSGKVSK